MLKRLTCSFLFLGIFSGIPSVCSDCQPGTCSLDPYDTGYNKTCPIPADTIHWCHQIPNNTFCRGRYTSMCMFFSDRPQPYCICSNSKYGEKCDKEVNNSIGYCTSDEECGGRTRGKCIPRLTGGTGKCQCNTGFQGVYCESLDILVEDIDFKSCEGRGFLYQLGSEIRCYCMCGFHGPTCNLVYNEVYNQTSCHRRICNNNGYCKFDSNGVGFCECKDGFHGKFCKYRVEKTPEPEFNGPQYTDRSPSTTERPYCNKQCLNGGNCVVHNGTEHCICRCGSFGPTCQYSTDETNTYYKNWCAAVDYVCRNGKQCYVNPGTCNLDCRKIPYITEPVFITTTRKFTLNPLIKPCLPYTPCKRLQCSTREVCKTDKCGNGYCKALPYENRKPSYAVTFVVYPVLIPSVIMIGIFVTVCLCRRRRRKRNSNARTRSLPSPTRRVPTQTLSNGPPSLPEHQRPVTPSASNSSTSRLYRFSTHNTPSRQNRNRTSHLNNTHMLSSSSVWSTSLSLPSTNIPEPLPPQTGTMAIPQYADIPPSYEDAITKPPSYFESLDP